MFQSGNYNEDNPVVSGRHSRKCCILNGGDLVETYNWDGRPKEELSDKCDVVMKAPDVGIRLFQAHGNSRDDMARSESLV